MTFGDNDLYLRQVKLDNIYILKLHLRKRCGKEVKQDYRTKEAGGII